MKIGLAQKTMNYIIPYKYKQFFICEAGAVGCCLWNETPALPKQPNFAVAGIVDEHFVRPRCEVRVKIGATLDGGGMMFANKNTEPTVQLRAGGQSGVGLTLTGPDKKERVIAP